MNPILTKILPKRMHLAIFSSGLRGKVLGAFFGATASLSLQAALSLAVHLTTKPQSLPDLIAQTEKSTVIISTVTPFGASEYGAGWFVNGKGYIVTAAHVVSTDNNPIVVTLADGGLYPATVVGSDAATDISVLHITFPGRTPFLRWGNSDDIRAGDAIVQIGDPLNDGLTPIPGIVASPDREIQTGVPSAVKYIQGTPPTAPGDSGGPVVEQNNGRIIGMVAALVSPAAFDGSALQLGDDITPANVIKRVVSQMIASGHVTTGNAGFSYADAPAASGFGIAVSHVTGSGALITAVDPYSPAQSAGLKTGDVVQQFDGAPVGDATDLMAQIYITDPRKKHRLTVARRGQILAFDLVMTGQYPDNTSRVAMGGAKFPAPHF